MALLVEFPDGIQNVLERVASPKRFIARNATLFEQGAKGFFIDWRSAFESAMSVRTTRAWGHSCSASSIGISGRTPEPAASSVAAWTRPPFGAAPPFDPEIMRELKETLDLDKRIRVVSIDGGGLYGLTQAIWLRKLCEQDPEFLKPHDDVRYFFAGTSSGNARPRRWSSGPDRASSRLRPRRCADRW